MADLSIRPKGDKLIVKLGNESCELNVREDFTDETTQIIKVLSERRQEILAKRRRQLQKEFQ